MDDYIQSHATEEEACKAVLETKKMSANRWVSTHKICFKLLPSKLNEQRYLEREMNNPFAAPFKQREKKNYVIS